MTKREENPKMPNDSKHDIEQQRLALEREKLRIEWFKAWWTGFAIFIPLLVAAATIFFNTKNQLEQAQIDFKLKAAEIVLNAQGPTETKNKAEAMASLFPEYLAADFAESFIPLDFGNPRISTSQKELLTLIIEHPDQRNEIIDMWLQVAPYDKWAEKLKK